MKVPCKSQFYVEIVLMRNTWMFEKDLVRNNGLNISRITSGFLNSDFKNFE